MLDLFLHNARLVFPREGERPGGIGVRDGKIAGVYPPGEAPAARRALDAGGRALLPGVFDPHIHLGVRGDSYDEECVTETRAALKGGVTTVGCYLRERGSYVGKVEDFAARAESRIFTDVLFHLVILEKRQLADLPMLADRYGHPAFKFYLHGIPELPIMSPADLVEAFQTIAGLERPGLACVHAEDHAMCVEGKARLQALGNPRGLADWTMGSPEGAEAAGVRICADTAEKTGATVYIVHLSSGPGLGRSGRPRPRGFPCCASPPRRTFTMTTRTRRA